MTATLRVVLDQAVAPTDPDLARATVELTRALIETAPKGTAVAGIAPAGELPTIAGMTDVWRSPQPRARLSAAWQLGVASGVGGGLIHSPTLLAPLVRHDRVNDNDQTVVTLWSLDPWLAPAGLPRAHVAAQRALLARAAKHADAVIVPSHAVADDLSRIKRFSDRVRVIPGAAPATFCVPTDAAARRRDLALPDEYVAVLDGLGEAARAGVVAAFRAVAEVPGLVALVLGGDVDGRVDGGARAGAQGGGQAGVHAGGKSGAQAGGQPGAETPTEADAGDAGDENAAADADAAGRLPAHLAALAAEAGLAPDRVLVLDLSNSGDRAAALEGAQAVLAVGTSTAHPWRLLEALTAGAPILASSTPMHTELLVDGAHFVDAGDEAALREALHGLREDAALAGRLRIHAADRSQAFAWRDTAERVWALHADL